MKVLARVIAVVVLTAFGVSVGLVAEAVAWGEKTVKDDGVSEGKGKGTVGINSTDIGGHNQRYDLRPGGNSIYTVSEFWNYGKWCYDESGNINCWLRYNPEDQSAHTTKAEWSDDAAYREKLNSETKKGRVITWVAKDKSLQPDPHSAKTTNTFTWP